MSASTGPDEGQLHMETYTAPARPGMVYKKGDEKLRRSILSPPKQGPARDRPPPSRFSRFANCHLARLAQRVSPTMNACSTASGGSSKKERQTTPNRLLVCNGGWLQTTSISVGSPTSTQHRPGGSGWNRVGARSMAIPRNLRGGGTRVRRGMEWTTGPAMPHPTTPPQKRPTGRIFFSFGLRPACSSTRKYNQSKRLAIEWGPASQQRGPHSHGLRRADAAAFPPSCFAPPFVSSRGEYNRTTHACVSRTSRRRSQTPPRIRIGSSKNAEQFQALLLRLYSQMHSQGRPPHPAYPPCFLSPAPNDGPRPREWTPRCPTPTDGGEGLQAATVPIL